MVRRTRTIALIGLLAMAGVTAGCQEKLTRPRYETIYMGQPAEQVQKTLGKPDARTDGTWTFTREKPYARVIIRFENNHVVDKAWYHDEADER
ncbi:MAG: hypothetical protein ACLFVW_09285 [Phycisphaerae bacterium]